MIETTIIISRSRMKTLDDASQLTGIKRTRIIVWAMKVLLERGEDIFKIHGPVKYQAKQDREKWRKAHLFLRPNEYDFFLDSRKFCKMSVSLLVAVAIDLYLDKFVEGDRVDQNSGDIPDNCLLHSYIVMKEIINSSICWKIYWGYPGNEHFLPVRE